MMRPFCLFICFIPFILTIINCSDNGTNPPPEGKLCEITDTTSHNFIFEIDTIGTFPSSLVDVTAIDENNVWAVGDIDLIDGPERDKYNAVKWDGKELQYKKLEVLSSSEFPSIQELRVALSFSEDNLWFFSRSGSYVRWDGTKWSSAFIWEQKGAPRKAWGATPDDFYFIGNNGSITHYDGNSFQLIDGGTTRDLFAIDGYIDTKTGRTNVWIAGEYVLLHFDGLQWHSIMNDTTDIFSDNHNYPAAIYSINENHIGIGASSTSGLNGYCVNTSDISEFKLLFTGHFAAYAMTGTAINDIFIVGPFTTVVHYNGSTIKEFTNLEGFASNTGIAYKNGHVFIAGISGQKGIFIRGTRQ